MTSESKLFASMYANGCLGNNQIVVRGVATPRWSASIIL
jgi:hypothetical protein